jgi:Restriction endonuclease BglII
MFIAGRYSFNGGEEYIQQHFPHLLQEIETVIGHVDASKYKIKVSKEKTKKGKMLYDPSALNKAFKAPFHERGWEEQRVPCDYPTKFYTPRYQPKVLNKGAFREMDFIKGRLGIEVQFGKYAFMVYNVCAKMTIFHKRDFIDAGVEIVAVKQFTSEMSSGVSYFEQFVWDLENRGVSNIDIPVLVLGVATENLPEPVVIDTQEELASSTLWNGVAEDDRIA